MNDARETIRSQEDSDSDPFDEFELVDSDPSADDLEAEVIRQRSQCVRAQLRENVEGLKVQTRALFDWRHHARAHPWITLAAGAAMGALIMRRRSTGARPDPGESGARVADRRAGESGSAPPDRVAQVFDFLGQALLSATAGLAGQQMGRILGELMTEPRSRETAMSGPVADIPES